MGQFELLIRKSELLRELQGRKNLEAGIVMVNGPFYFRPILDIEADLQVVENQLIDIEYALVGISHPSSPKGNLKEAVQDWAESEGFQQGVSVSSKKIAKFVREHSVNFPNLSDGSVRSTLSRLGYSEEKIV
jgi:hypothetical protein